MKKFCLLIFICIFFLLISCENDVPQNVAPHESVKTANVLYTTDGEAILIEGSLRIHASTTEGFKTGSRAEGLGFIVDSGILGVSEVKLSLNGNNVSEDQDGSITAVAYASDYETYYIFTYEEKQYLVSTDSLIGAGTELKTLSLDWVDVTTETLYLGEDEMPYHGAVWYAEDGGKTYYKIFGLDM